MAIEIVVTPLIFAAAGFGIDTWLGTRPVFTALLGIVAFAGKVAGEWYRYSSRMDVHAQEIAGNRPTHSRGLRRRGVPEAQPEPAVSQLGTESATGEPASNQPGAEPSAESSTAPSTGPGPSHTEGSGGLPTGVKL